MDAEPTEVPTMKNRLSIGCFNSEQRSDESPSPYFRSLAGAIAASTMLGEQRRTSSLNSNVSNGVVCHTHLLAHE
jgi:hypothetical protein